MKATNKTINKVVLFAFCIVLLFLLINMLLTPARVFTEEVKQMAQIMSIDAALELFNSEFDHYPPSDALDPVGKMYCGAMRLAEAMMGQDLMGFHPDSIFLGNRTDGSKILYFDEDSLNSDEYKDNLNIRKGPYLPLENANAYQLMNIYGKNNTTPFSSNHFVLCDVHRNVIHHSTGKKIGMPILYYKADTSKTAHDVNNPDNPENIYNYRDNYDLLALGVPGQPGKKHPLYENPALFYKMTRNYHVTTITPHKEDTYILLSAGYDGLYGTSDDIANFDISFKWQN